MEYVKKVDAVCVSVFGWNLKFRRGVAARAGFLVGSSSRCWSDDDTERSQSAWGPGGDEAREGQPRLRSWHGDGSCATLARFTAGQVGGPLPRFKSRTSEPSRCSFLVPLVFERLSGCGVSGVLIVVRWLW
jgi:hypothetical protein